MKPFFNDLEILSFYNCMCHSMSHSMPRIDVCIATYNRPAFLRKLLETLMVQETEDKFTFAVIVSDNDGNRSAEPLVREFAHKGMRIIYDVEPRRNISLNRNRTLSHVSGDYVAMVDDDQYVSERWLLSLYNTSVAFQAEVVCGPVIPVFEQGASVLVRKSNAFGLPNLPDGFSGDFIYHTGNCFFRADLLASMKTPFDVELGRARGEDTRFFEELREQGCKMVWSHAAVCFEHFPPNRANLRWLLKRYYGIGFILFPAFGTRRGFEAIHLRQNLKALHLLLKIIKEILLFPIFAVLSAINTRFIEDAVRCLKHAAMHLGVSAYFLNSASKRRQGN